MQQYHPNDGERFITTAFRHAATAGRCLGREAHVVTVLWAYPQGPLPDTIEYSVEIEADDRGVRVMVARDDREVPHGIAVAVGDDPAELGEVLSMWGIGFPPDVPDSPPDDWFDTP